MSLVDRSIVLSMMIAGETMIEGGEEIMTIKNDMTIDHRIENKWTAMIEGEAMMEESTRTIQ
jgi:hypothetical protein